MPFAKPKDGVMSASRFPSPRHVLFYKRIAGSAGESRTPIGKFNEEITDRSCRNGIILCLCPGGVGLSVTPGAERTVVCFEQSFSYVGRLGRIVQDDQFELKRGKRGLIEREDRRLPLLFER